MITVEGVVLIVVIGAAVFYVGRKAYASFKGEEGSCRSCGDTCSCAIKDGLPRTKDTK